jgi:flagellar hook-associated protein 2
MGKGGVIIGKTGTVIDGLSLIYSGNGADTTNISFSQGIADLLYNVVSTTTPDKTGIIDTAVSKINSENEDSDKEINKLNEQLQSYRDKLIKQYSAVENAVSKINSLLQMLDANDAAKRQSAG